MTGVTRPFSDLPRARPRWAGYFLGFGMGGFFDGILLHQILQWHHLLSGLQTGTRMSLGTQIMADGVFHAVMYAVALAGLWGLYRASRSGVLPRRALLADFLLGFGAWHIVDALLSHWLTGIHRIRMDVPDPLPWDLGWFLFFGIMPALLGVALRRRDRNAPATGAPRCHDLLAIVLATSVISAGIANLVPLRSSPQAASVVVLRPDVSAAALFAALDGTSAAVIWADTPGQVWVLTDVPRRSLPALYGAGAMYVAGAGLPAGCASWLALAAPRRTPA